MGRQYVLDVDVGHGTPNNCTFKLFLQKARSLCNYYFSLKFVKVTHQPPLRFAPVEVEDCSISCVTEKIQIKIFKKRKENER